jgi:hypothetical protein
MWRKFSSVTSRGQGVLQKLTNFTDKLIQTVGYRLDGSPISQRGFYGIVSRALRHRIKGSPISHRGLSSIVSRSIRYRIEDSPISYRGFSNIASRYIQYRIEGSTILYRGLSDIASRSIRYRIEGTTSSNDTLFSGNASQLCYQYLNHAYNFLVWHKLYYIKRIWKVIKIMTVTCFGFFL